MIYSALIPLLSHIPGVQVLKLSNNGMGPQAGAAVAKALVDSANLRAKNDPSSTLRVLYCARNRLEDGSASEWANVIAANPSLQKIKLANNGFREKGIVALAKSLAPCHDLRYLSLRDCISRYIDSHEPEDERGSRYLADAVKAATRLELLDLSDCSLNAAGSWHIIHALSDGAHTELHTLLLENNDMTDDHYKAILDILPEKLPKLRLLSLVLNEDLEENESVEAIKEILEGRGGRIIVEEDEDGNEEDLLEDARDAEKEERFVSQITGDSSVDALTELLGANLSLNEFSDLK